MRSMFATLALMLGAVSASAVQKRDFGPLTIYTPPSSYKSDKVLYARSLTLTVNDTIGTMLTTWENYSDVEPPWFPIYRSTDHGYTWTSYSTIKDTVNGWGLRYQPALYELKQSLGGFAAGTILAAGNSIPSDLSKTKIDLYASKDKGKTWSFVSTVASGGRAVPNNGETPVWEPFFFVYNNQLIIYYSDQRDSAHGQKLVHQVSSDLKTWGSVVTDFASSTYSHRPGMPVVAQLGNGKYIMTFEFGGASEANFAVYYKIANSPTTFASANAVVLRTTANVVPTSSPYVVWTPAGGTNGTIVVSAYSSTQLFLNRGYGSGSWTTLATTSPGAYSRSLDVGFVNKDIVVIAGGPLGKNGVGNKITITATDVNGCTTC